MGFRCHSFFQDESVQFGGCDQRWPGTFEFAKLTISFRVGGEELADDLEVALHPMLIEGRRRGKLGDRFGEMLHQSLRTAGEEFDEIFDRGSTMTADESFCWGKLHKA